MSPSLFSKEFVKSFKCDVYQLAKHHCATYPLSNTKSIHPFDLVHFDVWGPASNSSISGTKWFVTFIDDCTCVTRIFLMKEKSEFLTLFVKFFHMIKIQFEKSIKHLHFDNGREYINHDMSKFLFKNGVVHEFTWVDTAQQNGIAKRKNRHFLEVT